MRKTYIIFSIFILAFQLAGCGKESTAEQELADFSCAMSEFAQDIMNAQNDMANIDITSGNSEEELISILERMDKSFQSLSELEIPAKYQSVEQLADEAYDNMENAINNYRIAFDSEAGTKQDYDLAYQYYCRAMKRVEYIGYILSGNIPESDAVNVYEESNDSMLIDKILQRNEFEDGTYSYTETEVLEIDKDFFNP